MAREPVAREVLKNSGEILCAIDGALDEAFLQVLVIPDGLRHILDGLVFAILDQSDHVKGVIQRSGTGVALIDQPVGCDVRYIDPCCSLDALGGPVGADIRKQLGHSAEQVCDQHTHSIL